MDDDELIPPEDAFETIGNNIRASIIQILQDAFREGQRELSYSTLQSRAGIRDSGRFNYHLQQLVGQFVDKRDSDYALTYAGRKVASAIAAGTFNAQTELEPKPVAGTCYACGEAELEVSYTEEQFFISCTACEEEVLHMPFPPGAVTSHQNEELDTVIDHWARSWNVLAAKKVCPECGSRMHSRIASEQGALAIGNVVRRGVLDCTECWVTSYMPLGCLIINHPVVISFYWNHGRSIHDKCLWEFEWALADDYQEPMSNRDEAVRLTIPLDGDELQLTIDDSLDVTSHTVLKESADASGTKDSTQ